MRLRSGATTDTLSHAHDGALEALKVERSGFRGLLELGIITVFRLYKNRWTILASQILATLLVILYGLFPVFLKLNPGVMVELAFLNKITWPPFINMTEPHEFGLNTTRYFRLDSTDNVELGVWHSLPKELHGANTVYTNDEYEKYLSAGFPIIVYYHGNAGTRAARHRVQLYKVLYRAGYHVVTFDYRGYADSTGKPSEEGLMEDAITVYNYVRQHSGKSPVYIWGHSMGSGVATKTAKYLCENGLEPDAVVLESPFNNLLEAASNHPLTLPFRVMPWFPSVFTDALELNDLYFHSDRSIGSVTVPMLILHARDDGIVPYELGWKLYQAALNTKTRGGVEFISFEEKHNYGHKHIHKAPDLPDIIRKFTTQSK